MSSFKRIISIIFFILLNVAAFAQSNMPGDYTIKSYTTKDYGYHPRNFYVSQDANGLIYAGNAYGALEFDGTRWRNIGLINSESAMCIVPAPDGLKYVGANREAGYLFVDSTGETRYHSLGDKLPEDKSLIGTITNIFPTNNGLLFCGGSKALLYKNGVFHWLMQGKEKFIFSYAQKIGNKIYFHQEANGLLEYKNGSLLSVPNGDLLKGISIVELIAKDDKQFIVVTDQDLFLFDGVSLKRLPESNGILKNHRLSHALRLTNGNILVATHDAGAFIFDEKGALQKQFTLDNGLQSNNINHACCDNRGNLWLALDNGIAYVEINTAFSFLERASGLAGMGMAAAVFDGKLYLGTSQGLYYSEWNQHTQQDVFKPVKGLSGQVWELTVANDVLICNHVSRLYTIKGDQATPVFTESPDKGNWKTILLKKYPGYVLVGTYTGLQLYQLTNGSIQYIRNIAGFEEACRTFIEDTDGAIWVAHGNRGLYRLVLDETLQQVKWENHTLKNGFTPDFLNHINYLDGKLVFVTDEGPYAYDATKDKLIFNNEVAKYFSSGYLNKFYQFSNQDIILFKAGPDIILFRKKGNGYEEEYFLLKKLFRMAVGSYEFAMQLNNKFIIIGTEQGFTLFNTQFKAEHDKSFQVRLRSITAPFQNDSLLFSGNFKSKNEVLEFPYSLNSIRLSYASNFYESSDKMVYQYAWAKKGEKLSWSGWNNHTDIDLTDLDEGHYELHLRARNVYGTLSKEAVYDFRILPPWYRSAWAYAVYTVLLCIAAYFIFLLIKKRFKKQQFELEQKYLIESLQKDKVLIQLQREALEEKLVIQNNELSSMAAMLNQRSELLNVINEKINSFEDKHPQFDHKLVREFMKSVDQYFNAESTWSNFQNQFDGMHQDFLKRFQEKHPRLDESWLLLCAYIRMNKSYKEISNQLNISVAAVDKRLYRLKDKLGLGVDDKIREYIQNF